MHPIAVVRGASDAVVQGLLAAFVARWGSELRIAGVLAEGHGLPDRACSAGYLRTVGNGDRFSMFQDLGSGSTACHLEGAGVLAAAEKVREHISAGCDLVVLNKFGKLEATGGGLRDAFAAALEAGVPVLTAVSPSFDTAWREFASPLYSVIAPDAAAIDDWCRNIAPFA